MAHTCKNLVIHCIDFRLMDQLFDWLKTKEMVVATCDEVAIAGAIKDLVEPKNSGEAEFILKQIDISAKLHKIERVILMNHTDCGAYGGHSAFSNEKEEEGRHLKDMNQAKKIILSRWPHLKVMLVLADIKDDGTIEFKKAG